MKQAPGGEFALISSFLKPFGGRPDLGAGVLVGPGSDCAVMKVSPGQQLVVTTDAAFEGVHFDLGLSAPEDAGHKALAMNLSDLAAAGARPRWFLCALGVPAGALRPSEQAARFARGMAALARRHQIALVGGNVTSALQWSLTITALGEARRPLTRAGGKPGDALVVVGRLGGAALGLRELRAGAPSRRAAAQLRPVPLCDAGLVAARYASASIDVSDGLLADLGHLLKASRCGARLDAEALPLSPRATLPQALTGGEDYALLLAVSPRRLPALLAALREPVAVVGSLERNPGLRVVSHGAPLALPEERGWDHLRGGR